MENMINIQLSASQVEFLLGLGMRLNTQDNYATRRPNIFKIAHDELRVVPLKMAEIIEFKVSQTGRSYLIKDLSTLISDLLELVDGERVVNCIKYLNDACGFKELESVFNQVIELSEGLVDGEVNYYEVSRSLTQEFLTEEAALEYISKFGYKYNNPRLWCIHAADNEELAMLLDIVKGIKIPRANEQFLTSSVSIVDDNDLKEIGII